MVIISHIMKEEKNKYIKLGVKKCCK